MVEKRSLVNIACGRSFSDSPEWTNFDFAPQGKSVKQANLLGRIPLPDDQADCVYTSHFVEHIPRHKVVPFFSECSRILKPGGTLRVVVPDFEEMCAEYLRQRTSGRDKYANYLTIEILDQCVRKQSGGELARFYASSALRDDRDLQRYVQERVGDDFPSLSGDEAVAVDGRRSMMSRLRSFALKKYVRAVCHLLPGAFVAQNVSFAEVGENHAWLHDYNGLSHILEKEAGFTGVRRCTHLESRVPGHPCMTLDVLPSGAPRKGVQSMFIEALKPG